MSMFYFEFNTFRNPKQTKKYSVILTAENTQSGILKKLNILFIERRKMKEKQLYRSDHRLVYIFAHVPSIYGYEKTKINILEHTLSYKT